MFCDSSSLLPVSVVIPARNSASTLERTIRSLLEQTHPNWEAIIVENGSSDATAEVAQAWAERDGRIRWTRSEPGVGAARNAGIAAARSPWLLFLDADDWILPRHLETLTSVVAADTTFDAVHCGWRRVAEDGTVLLETVGPDREDLFPDFARTCVFSIHACLVRKAVVEAAGGFDPALQTCEDWDLWQRIARLGARFRVHREVLACYLLRPGSSSSRALRMAADAQTVIRRGHGPDARLRERGVRVVHAEGVPAAECRERAWYSAIWSAGLAVGQGEDPVPVLDVLGDGPAVRLDAESCAGSLLSSVMLAQGRTTSAWAEAFSGVEDGVTRLLDEVEARLRQPGLSRASRRCLERRAVEWAALERPFAVGGTRAVEIDLADPVTDVVTEPEVERVHLRVRRHGEIWGSLELPVVAGRVPSEVLLDALAAEFGWRLLGAWFQDRVYPGLEVEAQETPGRWTVRRGEVVLGRDVPSSLDGSGIDWRAAHDGFGWTVLLQEVFGRPEMTAAEFYGPSPELPGASGVPGPGRTVTVDVADAFEGLAASPEAVNLVMTVGGVPVSRLRLPGPVPPLSGDAVRAALVTEAGVDLCRAVVRKALLGSGFGDGWNLRERLAAVVRERRRSGEAWPRTEGRAGFLVLPRHQVPAGGGVTFRAQLPLELREELERGGRPLLERGEGEPDRILYLPEIAASGGPEAAAAAPRSVRPSAPGVGARVAGGTTRRLPILMYHGVGDDAGPERRRYQVGRESFAAQVRWLAENGFRSATLDEWRRARAANAPLEGKRVMFTFDDGFRDFRENAWPVLRDHGFGAVMFVPSGHVGGRSRWDDTLWESVPLLDWEEIGALHAEGVEFGSHTRSHAYLTGLAPAEVARELWQDKVELERRLGVPVEGVAYPYGAVDRVVESLAGACGFVYGLTCGGKAAEREDRLLALPRLEVDGRQGLEWFQEMVLREGGFERP